MGSQCRRDPAVFGVPPAFLALWASLALWALLSACGDEAGAGDGGDPQAALGEPAHADIVVDALSAPPEDAERAINGVRGGGRSSGSHDVLSLGSEPGVDNWVVLRWSGRRVLDGPGADVVVFENAFVIGSGPEHFMDPAIVEVSRDGEHWVAFPHRYEALDPAVYSADPAHWVGFAGVQPVLLHEEENRVNPFDAAGAGGDRFDLGDLPRDGGEGDAIREEGFVYLRVVTAASRINPDTGEPYVRDPVSVGADIDGVYARYFAEED